MQNCFLRRYPITPLRRLIGIVAVRRNFVSMAANKGKGFGEYLCGIVIFHYNVE